MLAISTVMTMDGISTLTNAMINKNQGSNNAQEYVTFDAIHLNNTDIKKASAFWTEIVGMKQRSIKENIAEFGTEDNTLVVVHQAAKSPYEKGYSGLYHFAIHAPNLAEFARMINRLNERRYPYSPVDHTMLKSIYLDDPDGINIEFTLETPERLKRVISSGGFKMEGTDGVIRSVSDRLDLNEVMDALEDKDLSRFISKGSNIGHIHLYANNLINSNNFYKTIGFNQFNYFPEFMYADLGAGGDFQHRVAMNRWHGKDRPLAPVTNAGLRYFQINYRNPDKLKSALSHYTNFEKTADGYLVADPTGNLLLLS